MSVKANSTLIGAFVVGSLVLLIAGIVIFSKGQFFSQVDKYVLYFDGTVAGLNVGSSVTFRGVKIGKVDSVKMLFYEDTMTAKIPVVIQIESMRIVDINVDPRLSPEEITKRLIKSGLRARLEMESLVTGQLMIELDFYPGYPDRRLSLDDTQRLRLDDEYPELPTIPSSFQEITSKIKKIPIQELALKIQYMVEGISDLVRSPELMETITTLNATMKDIQHLVQNTDRQLDPIMANVNNSTKEAVKVIKNVDDLVHNVKTLSGNTNDLVKGSQGLVTDTKGLVNNVDKRIATLMNNFITASETANATLKEAHETMKTVDGLASENSPFRQEVMSLFRELTAAARSIRYMAEYLERHPDALIYGKGGNRGRKR